MAKKSSKKPKVVAFKVEEDLADFLDRLPNKSDFIRKAVLAQFGMTCPLCTGRGMVPRGVHDHFKPVLARNDHKGCEKCKASVVIPMNTENVSATDQKRIEQFLHGGHLYCANCYPTVPTCDDCGWHVPTEKVAEHFKKVHTRAVV